MTRPNSGMSDVEIRDLTSDTASSVFNRMAPSSSLQPAGRVDNLGLYFDNRLIVAVQIGAPRSAEILLRYSKEIYELVFLESADESPGYAAEMLGHYFKTYKPADICASPNGHDPNIYLSAGMNLAADFPREKVFEWVDLNRTYYTYKITASDSPKFYYGVSHLKIADATEQDCLTDGYWGSGSTRMQEWKADRRKTLEFKAKGDFGRDL